MDTGSECRRPADAATDVPQGRWATLEKRGVERELIGALVASGRRGGRSAVPGARGGIARSRLLHALIGEAETARQGSGLTCGAVEG